MEEHFSHLLVTYLKLQSGRGRRGSSLDTSPENRWAMRCRLGGYRSFGLRLLGFASLGSCRLAGHADACVALHIAMLRSCDACAVFQMPRGLMLLRLCPDGCCCCFLVLRPRPPRQEASPREPPRAAAPPRPPRQQPPALPPRHQAKPREPWQQTPPWPRTPPPCRCLLPPNRGRKPHPSC